MSISLTPLVSNSDKIAGANFVYIILKWHDNQYNRRRIPYNASDKNGISYMFKSTMSRDSTMSWDKYDEAIGPVADRRSARVTAFV